MNEVYIVSALRTPIGGFQRSLSSLTAAELGALIMRAAFEKALLLPEHIDVTIMGQVLQSGHGMNPARQAALNAGLNHQTPAYLVNQVCGSGMRAVIDGAQHVMTGQADIALVGGMESMSRAPHAIGVRSGTKFGHTELRDTMLSDGLWDAFNDYHMGMTAENIVERHNISREAQDEYSLSSQMKAKAAQQSGRFNNEIVPVTIKTKKGEITLSHDEVVRGDTDLKVLSSLEPVFKKEGTITAGNSSPLNDGSSAIILANRAAVKEYGLTPLGKIKSFASVGVDPAVMGEGPVPASRKAIEKAGWNMQDLDLIESNEAFAAQSIYVMRELNWKPDKVNVNGGAIALGHPIGSSGARLLVTLVHEMNKRDVHKGLATLCIGGGMGIAMTLER